MNKIFKSLIVAVAAVGLMSGAAFAGSGELDIGANAFQAAGDADIQFIPNGMAGGLGGAIGVGHADADGFVLNGDVEGEVNVVGGGLTNTSAYKMHNPIPAFDKSIGVGSSSQSQGNAAADAKIKVDPARGFALGEVDAQICGFTAQGTLNGSGLIQSPIYFDTTGLTGGIAGQGSVGGFHGEAFAISGPDYGWCRPVDSKAGAGMGAEITMVGSSFSESYRAVDWNPCTGTKTELMGTNVGAATAVETSGYDYDWDKGLGYANADVDGGWIAAGGAASLTVQNAPGPGAACATAIGGYVGAGGLNTNFVGSANGGTYTSVTTVNGMNGSINTAGSSMAVTANTTHGSN